MAARRRIHETADKLEQRHWLFEAAQEFVRRRGPEAAIELLEQDSLPAASLGGRLEASVDALTGKRGRSIVWKYLDSSDDYALATALRVLSQSSDDPKELSRLLDRAEGLAEHPSPLVRIALPEALVWRDDLAPTQLILNALRDPSLQCKRLWISPMTSQAPVASTPHLAERSFREGARRQD